MTQDIDLKAIEKKAFTSYHRDGMSDIIAGLALLLAGFSMLYHFSTFAVIMYAVFVPLGVRLRKSIITPRIGFVKFSKARLTRKNRLMTIAFSATVIVGVFNFIAFAGGESSWKEFVRGLELVPFGIVAAFIMALVGYLFAINRLIVYALLTAGSIVTFHLLGIPPPANFFLLGAVILFTGLVLLLNFLKKYPLSKPGETGHAG